MPKNPSMTIQAALVILGHASGLKVSKTSGSMWDFSTRPFVRAQVRRKSGESLESMLIRVAESIKPWTYAPGPAVDEKGRTMKDGCATCRRPGRGLIWAGKKVGWQCGICNDFSKAPAHANDLIGPVKGDPQ